LPDWSIGRNVFEIERLARRRLMATAWIRQNAQTSDLLVEYFGASTDATVALVAGS
jgi:hypothetical protein